jgi:hypothetical protein
MIHELQSAARLFLQAEEDRVRLGLSGVLHTLVS